MRWAFPRVLGGAASAFALQLLTATALWAQGTGTIRGRVIESGGSRPIGDAQVLVEGTTNRAMTNAAGEFTIPGVPVGPRSVTARRIGFTPATQRVEVVADQTATVTISLGESASQLESVVVTAFGETAAKRALGTSSQTVVGSAVAETQRENFLNALQGRVAGVQVNSTSGVPGASSQITIRGVSSISSSNQPLFVIDGMPMDNKTLHSGVLASSFGGSTVSFENRGVDFTNRAADLNPEDIESITVLKGPEAAALYGIDAANGAIVITTKRGQDGGGLEYNNSFRIENVRNAPEVQRIYGPADSANFNFRYWGPKYADGTRFYDNVDGFFQPAMTQRHNLSLSGAAPDNRVNYRVTGAAVKQQGVIPTTDYNRYNITGAGQAQPTRWLNVDLTTAYSYTDNRQPFKGISTVNVGPLIALLAWPQTDDASDWLTAAGTRRRVTNLSAGAEIDNPYFGVEKNHVNSTNNRILVNLALRFTPFSWGNFKTQIGTDAYANHNEILRHPESSYGAGNGGQIDVADDNTRNLSAQALFNLNHQELGGRFGVSGLVGTSAQDNRSHVDALWGSQFLETDFVSINNTTVNRSKTTIAQRRLQSVFGQATLDYANYLFLTVSGRNDWTSTIPVERNSFFYPSVSSSFIFSDAFPSLGRLMTGKLRAAYAEVGRDASPYAYRPSLQYKTTSFGGYGYDFWGPNFKLRPEFARSYEFGTELGFFDDRLGVDATVYRKETRDQIVQNIRGTYATGFILFNLNGASTRNTGVELTVRGMPLRRPNATWEVIGNFDHSKGIVLSLPNALPESYNSDTWLYGNVRNGNTPGMSTMALTGNFYQRTADGKHLVISPTTGLPVRVPGTAFVDRGYDRQPDFTLGVTNNLTYRKARLSMLWDFRRGGDIFNATEHLLTVLGLSKRTLDRETPRVIPGVLQDGLENTDHPTPNNIVLVPATTPGYYTAMSEELFIEKDINWARLRDVTLSYMLPQRFGRTSLFVTGTDLLLFTNYSGLDPIVNGNTAAVGGSGAVGFDFGNFPIPRGFNFGLRTSF